MSAPDPHGLAPLRDALRQFAEDRDWDLFHSPKMLAAALSVVAAELLERFQWLTEDQSRRLPPAELAKVREEMADVLTYLVRLADKLDVNLIEAARDGSRGTPWARGRGGRQAGSPARRRARLEA